MNFDDPRTVDMLCYSMREADRPRAENRARIDQLFGGWAPWSDQEADDNGIDVNVNFLGPTRIAHDARSQGNNAILKPGNFFRSTTDMGAVHKRSTRSANFTRNINRIMKRSLPYMECHRSKIGQVILHSIGVSGWENQDNWCEDPLAIGDVFIPSNTAITMKGLSKFAIHRSLSAPELMALTQGPKRDMGWQMKLVNSCLEWIDKQASSLLGNNWVDSWTAEKRLERIKGDGSCYASDAVPVINAFDFYYYSDEGKDSGWRRRMILDAWNCPPDIKAPMTRRPGNVFKESNTSFLFNSGKRKYADKLSEILAFQFGDLSSTFPARYHNQRGLGFLLFASGHLQNRLRCRFIEAIFENLTMLFRARSGDDVQRLLKVRLANKGFVDEAMQFIPAAERFQINAGLAELGLREMDGVIDKNSSSYTQNTNFSADRVEKTRFQVMAEVNAMMTLISSALQQSYAYQKFQYDENVRRFLRPNSRDPDVKLFRANCLRDGIPENMMVPEAWVNEPERLMGAGNKTLEMTIAQQLMEWRDRFDPEPQRTILREAVMAFTDDPARAQELVPEKPVIVTDSVHDAQTGVVSALMMGLPVGLKTGVNHPEYVETLLIDLAILVNRAHQAGDMASAETIMGMRNVENHIKEHIAVIAQDKLEKGRVKRYMDQLGKLMNLVKAFEQRLQEQMQAAAQNGNGADPEKMQELQFESERSRIKLDAQKASAAQRQAQGVIKFQNQQQQADAKHKLEVIHDMREHQAEMTKKEIETRVAANKAKKAKKPKPNDQPNPES